MASTCALTTCPTRSTSCWLVDALFGADVADVNHAFDSFGELHEGAELGQVGDGSFDRRSNLKALRDVRPGITQRLLEPQREAAFAGVDLQDHDLDGLALLDHIAGFADFALRPRHLGNVNQTLDAGLEFDECSELHKARDGAAYAIAGLKLFRDRIPGMGLQLLQSNRDALLVALCSNLKHFHFDALVRPRVRPRAC